jgi:hypothetical protein
MVLKNKMAGDMVWIHADPANGGSGIKLRDQQGIDIFDLDADLSAIVLRNKAGGEMIWIHADPINGGSGIELRDQSGSPTILIDGDKGDIRILNADCAEDFEIISGEDAKPGAVMTINASGQLTQCKQPYDKRVAGVISGAGDLRPGLVLGRQTGRTDRSPIALMGRVLCNADAGYGSIEVGDLLTTSATSGHAMKASDPARAFGAVLGKALQPLRSGRDLIPILVALQ